MKKLLMIVAMAAIALTGYSKPNDIQGETKAQKPVITLYVTGDAMNHTITLHASAPVPETVNCEGQYQAPNSTTGYWYATLNTGYSEVVIPSDITESYLVDLCKVYAGGREYDVSIHMGGSFETNNAIYECIYEYY